MARRELRIAVAVCVLVIVASMATAQVSGKIEGTVVDGDGKALTGVKVEAVESETGTKVMATDKSGRYRFLSVAPGDYKVTFTRDSFADVVRYGNVRLGGTLTLNVKMFPTGG
jgi:inosine/xanthosine triphosphate pyrophosphatase family protein